MTEYSEQDQKLIQSVMDKNLEDFEENLGRIGCTGSGVDRALYLASSFGLEAFCEMIRFPANDHKYYDGKIIAGIVTDDIRLIEDAVSMGGNICHDSHFALRVAVKMLKRDIAGYLVEQGCDIHAAFPPAEIQALFRSQEQSLNARKTLDLVSALKIEAGPADNVVPLRLPMPKLF